MQEIIGNFDGGRVRVGIVVSRFNSVITDRLEAGAVDCLHRHGVHSNHIVVVRVAGAFEIPAVARQLLHEEKVDGVVGLGCVIRGETTHYDYMCEAAVGGLAAIARELGKPVACGVLTVENMEQALDRSGGKHGHKGFEAAMAVLESISASERIRGMRT